MPRSGDSPTPKGTRDTDGVPHADTRQTTRIARPLPLGQWKVLLHADDLNSDRYVVETLTRLTPLDQAESAQRQREAERKGMSLVLLTHHERAELYERQFGKANLNVTIEPVSPPDGRRA